MTLIRNNILILKLELYLLNYLIVRELRVYMPVVYPVGYLSYIDAYLLTQCLLG